MRRAIAVGIRQLVGAACIFGLLASCKAAPAEIWSLPTGSLTMLPPKGWTAHGNASLHDNGRIYLTGEGTGAITVPCSADLDEYPILMVCMLDSLPGAVWSITVEKDGRKTVLLETKEEGEWLLSLKDKTGWKGRTDFVLGIELAGRKGDWIFFDPVVLVRFDGTIPAAPEAVEPAGKATLRPFAVQFLWKQVGNAVAYEVQYGRSEDFRSPATQKVVSPSVADYLWHLPEKELEPGHWFWRVRAVNVDGREGPWSGTTGFSVSGESLSVGPERKISPEHPLIMAMVPAKGMRENWNALPEFVRQNAYLRIDVLPLGDVEAACEAAQAGGIPFLLQVSSPHDFYGPTTSRVSLSQVERVYQKFPMLKGTFICEQACQFGGLDSRTVWQYMDRLIRLSAHYGRLTVWADGHWGRYQWLDMASNATLLATVRRHRANFVPVWKMNCGVTPYSLHGGLLGLWLSGCVDNWGVEPEDHYWGEAGFTDGGGQLWFKEGDRLVFPPSFYAQMLMMGMMSGASVYVLEPPTAIWEKEGVLAEHFTENILPIMKKLVADGIVPDRENVWSLVSDAIAFDKKPVWQWDYDPDLSAFFKEVFKPKSLFDVLPKTGAYPAPIFLASEMDQNLNDRLAKSFAVVEKTGGKTVLRKGAGERTADACLLVKGRNAVFAMNSSENRMCSQPYSSDLSGRFAGLSGALRTNEYLIAHQRGPRLEMTLRVQPGESSVRIALGQDVTSRPKVEFGGRAPDAHTVKWDPESPAIEIQCRSDKGGTLQLAVSTE